ncbi:MAG: hypothetical protein B7Y54_12255 [Polaromonas sp. 35-63-240]|jgi:hypothetical protein|nr:MAG: hypothetical protein B7Y54_12255 [Polaromonas sp. 35-63-240]OYY91446.1 MAG: hypothetical protein B7Y42_13160 [Polaromonas sp. 28-63-22]
MPGRAKPAGHLSVRADSNSAVFLKRREAGRHSLNAQIQEIAMGKSAKTVRETSDIDSGHCHDGPSVEETADDEDGLDLPVDPDEGMPLIPDDERVIDVPS